MYKVICMVLILTLSACSSSTGWRVSFGAAPVSNMADRQGLSERQPVQAADGDDYQAAKGKRSMLWLNRTF